MRRLSPVTITIAAVTLAAVVITGILVAGDGGDGDDGGPPGTVARPADAPVPDVRFAVVRDELHAPGGITPLPGDTRAAVVDVLEEYVRLGTLEPLRRGRIGRGLDRLFAPDAFASAAGRDRAAVFDEGAPVDPGAVPVRTEAALVGLAGGDGVPGAVVARIVVHVVEDGGAFAVQRSGELTLVPLDGRWVVDAYTIRVVRSGTGVDGAGDEERTATTR